MRKAHAAEGPVRLAVIRITWAAIAMGMLIEAIGRGLSNRSAGQPTGFFLLECATSLAFFLFLWYFVYVYRIVRLLQGQPGWATSYSPIGAVWRQIVPLYGIWFIFRWTGDVVNYANWRLRRRSWQGLIACVCSVLGLLLADGEFVYPGLVLLFASITLLVLNLRGALRVQSPDDGSFAPGWRGYFE